MNTGGRYQLFMLRNSSPPPKENKNKGRFQNKHTIQTDTHMKTLTETRWQWRTPAAAGRRALLVLQEEIRVRRIMADTDGWRGKKQTGENLAGKLEEEVKLRETQVQTRLSKQNRKCKNPSITPVTSNLGVFFGLSKLTAAASSICRQRAHQPVAARSSSRPASWSPLVWH